MQTEQERFKLPKEDADYVVAHSKEYNGKLKAKFQLMPLIKGTMEKGKPLYYGELDNGLVFIYNPCDRIVGFTTFDRFKLIASITKTGKLPSGILIGPMNPMPYGKFPLDHLNANIDERSIDVILQVSKPRIGGVVDVSAFKDTYKAPILERLKCSLTLGSIMA